MSFAFSMNKMSFISLPSIFRNVPRLLRIFNSDLVYPEYPGFSTRNDSSADTAWFAAIATYQLGIRLI